MPRVLITGGSGLLALNWACCIRDSWEVVLATHTKTVGLAKTRFTRIDLESEAELEKQLKTINPDLVVHTAGLTNVDFCEQHEQDALLANAVLARNVARTTAALGIKLDHISTDQLFDGSKSFCSENDNPSPLNVYGRTKLQAERWVAQENNAALLVRTNFFGWGHGLRRSISDWVICSLRTNKKIIAFENVYFTPVLVDSLVMAIHALLGSGASGLFNLVGEERISKYDFAIRLAGVFDLPVSMIERGNISLGDLAAKRPLDMSLNNKKVRGLLGVTMGSLEDFFTALRQQELSGRREELLTAVMG